MKIMLAGASGAIGNSLIPRLMAKGNEVYGITQSEQGAHRIKEHGAKPLMLNVLDPQAVDDAFSQVKPEIVIDMLTHLPKEYTPEAMRKAAELDAKIRLEGGANLLEEAKKYGAKRYIAQSSAFWYAPGIGLADESSPFAYNASPGIAAGVRIYDKIEERILHSKIEGVALRFGFFYGPGTWFYPGENMAEQVLNRQFSIIGEGQGVWNFVHIEDAADAIISAIRCRPGSYNIVNDHPSSLNEWLPAFARYIGAESPPKITEKEGETQSGADTVYYATRLRGASNFKAKLELNFRPREFEWLFNF